MFSATPRRAAHSGPSLLLHAWLIAICFAGVLCTAWTVYKPGLAGGFLFDDQANLEALGATGPVHDTASFLRYISSGDADPTGRPLTLLTFLLDAQDWPAAPLPFKRTNLLIHLLNGTLLTWVLLVLGRASNLDEVVSQRAAVFAAALWLVSPLLVSTTLYVIQREAMLPATFTLLGISCWCHGRSRLSHTPRRAIAWMLLGAWGCCVLATLCKGNGALLPLLLAMIEITVMARAETAPSQNLITLRRWALFPPLALLSLWLLLRIPTSIDGAAEFRPWTAGERLLTEPRILIDYLRLLWAPRVATNGLFNDQIVASTSWLHPWTTLPAVLAVVALIIGALRLRKRASFISLAILFFFAGHLIESTFLPLELYFEHRNYLPAMMMFWPLAVWLCQPRTENEAKKPRLYAAAQLGAAVGIFALLSALTQARAADWGHPHYQALLWARLNPDSPRAQTLVAGEEVSRGYPEAALARLTLAAKYHPGEPQLALTLLSMQCRIGHIEPEQWNRISETLRTTRSSARAIFEWFVSMVPLARDHACQGLDLDTLAKALDDFRHNAKFAQQAGRQQDTLHVAGLIALARHNGESALADFNEAVRISPTHDIALQQVALLGSAGRPDLALLHLDYYTQLERQAIAPFGMPRVHEMILKRQHYWENEERHMRQTLIEDIASREQEAVTSKEAH